MRMRLAKDILEFIELLNSNSVEYLIIGGHAVGFHLGRPVARLFLSSGRSERNSPPIVMIDSRAQADPESSRISVRGEVHAWR